MHTYNDTCVYAVIIGFGFGFGLGDAVSEEGTRNVGVRECGMHGG